jgi:hypothetical protein
MFSTYRAFEIEIEPRSGDIYPIAARAPGGDARGALQSPANESEFQALLDRLGRLDADETALLSIGTTLFRALFQGDIAKVYASSRAQLAPHEALCIRLRIAAEEAEIAALPWEFLADPDYGPLAMLDAPIARYLPQPTPTPILRTTLPLKVLLTSAHTPPPVAVERELHEVEAALRGLGEHVQIQVEPHLTTARFRELLAQEFQVWHFVGHGGVAADDKTAQLLFEDAQGDPDPVTAMELNILLNRAGLRLVVLDACDSAKLSTDVFRSIAPALIRAQIPAVIAQQLQAAEASTRAFVTDFYRALARGLPLDACVTEGRKAVMDAAGLGQPDWGIPVLYTRAEDGRLFDLADVTDTAAAVAAPASTPVSPAEAGQEETPAAPAEPDDAALTEQLGVLRRRGLELEHRASLYGRWPPHILRQFGDNANTIRDLKAQLRARSG